MITKLQQGVLTCDDALKMLRDTISTLFSHAPSNYDDVFIDETAAAMDEAEALQALEEIRAEADATKKNKPDANIQ